MNVRSSVEVSGIKAHVEAPREVLGLSVRLGALADHKDDDGDEIPCVVGPDDSAAEAYVVARCDAKTGRYRDDVAMLGFSGPALARAVFFKLATSPKEYRQLDTWDADDFAAWLAKQPSDSPFDSGDSASQ